MAYISFQPSDYFNTKLYTGTGAELAVSSVGFQPDWVWLKDRGAVASHLLTDAVRGATKVLKSNTSGAESTNAQALKSFDSTGFTLGTTGDINTNTNSYVSWNWRANGSGSANTDGSISSTVSANTTAGFSIVKYTGNLTSGANIGHGLGVKPAMIIIKNLDAAESWLCYHTSLGATKHIKLNAAEAAGTATSRFNDTEPTTSLFTVGNDPQTNGNSNDIIAYCFAEKKGFSKFGSYTGNGNADGPFIYTGFRPAFFLWKRHNSTGGWYMADNARSTFNLVDKVLGPNDTNQESGFGTVQNFDFCSNGIKLRGTNVDSNFNGGQYIFMAFAEHPLVSSNDIPATAR